jgi:uncharacterized membrane protein
VTGPTRGGITGRVGAAFRGALWPIPTLAILVAVGLGIALPALDAALEGRDGHPLTFVFGGGPSAARDLLAVIAGSLISVTGLVFSLTVVALQLASSQYSPRLLQTFATDRFVQLTLAQLTATFVYALTVLRTVRTEDAAENGDAFVPRLAITVSYVLALGSVVALVLFLGHLARSLRVETMLRDVHQEAGEVLDRELPSRDRARTPVPALPAGEPAVVPAVTSGFVVDVDEQRIVAAAEGFEAVVVLVPRIGDPVVTGTPLAHVWGGGPLEPELADAVRAAVRLQFERSTARDLTYSLRKVVDIAVRALSPGINDPTTAVHALSHASAILGDLLERAPAPRCLADDAGTVRVVVPHWSAAALVDLALEEPLQFASGQPAVLRRLAGLLREVAWRAPRGPSEAAIRRRLDELAAIAAESTSVPAEEVEQWRSAVEDALAGRWPARSPVTGAPAPPVATDG